MGFKKMEQEFYSPVFQKPDEPRWQVVLGWSLMGLVWIATLGLLIWLVVEFQNDQSYYCSAATPVDASLEFVRFPNRAAEPYSGPVDQLITDVVNVNSCELECKTNAACLFFTHDQTHSNCYLYHQSVLPAQNQKAAVPGPSDFKSDVYVKRGQKVVQIRGIL